MMLGEEQYLPTLCEINYDQGDILDHSYTPYRLRAWSARYPVKEKDRGYSYREFQTPTSGYESGRRTSLQISSCRPNTTFSIYGSREASRLTDFPNESFTTPVPGTGRRTDRAKTAASLPNLRRRNSSRNGYRLPGDDKLKWEPGLNTWVDAKSSQNPVPYVNFVNTAQLTDRGVYNEYSPREELPLLPCNRYLSHMHMYDDSAQDKEAERLAKLEEEKRRKREKARLAAEEKERQRLAAEEKERQRRLAQLAAQQQKSRSVRFDKPAWKPKQPASPLPHPTPPPTLKTSSPLPPKSPSPVIEEGEGEEDSMMGRGDTPTEVDETTTIAESEESPRVVEPSPVPTPPKTPTPVPTPREPPEYYSYGTDSVSTWLLEHFGDRFSCSERGTRCALHSIQEQEPDPPPSPPPKVPTPEPPPPKVDLAEPPKLNLTIKKEKQPPVPPVPQLPKTQVDKRARWKAQPKEKKPRTPTPEARKFDKRQTGDWIFGDDDFSEELQKKKEVRVKSPPRIPSPPRRKTPTPPPSPKEEKKMDAPPMKEVPAWAKKRWGKGKKLFSLDEEAERERLAEERRRKAQELFDKLKKKGHKGPDGEANTQVNFDDYGWLAKYCILNKASIEQSKRTFEIVDDENSGFLNGTDLIVALKAMNRNLTDHEEEYILRILEMTGYNPTDGADLKLFAVIAALSQKIAALDDWMRIAIDNMDFKLLQMKLFMCKTLWECNVDPETNKISIDQLCVELRAGGVSWEHEQEVRIKLGHLKALDLLDFLTYVPLFIMIHESVVDNPLDDSRVK